MSNNWKTYKLTELIENIVDNRGKTCPISEAGMPLIATNCIRNEKLYPDFINIRYVSNDTYKTWFRDHPKPDDLIFVLKGTPGRVCWTPNPINFCIAQDMVALRANKKLVDPKFLFALLRSPIAQNKISALHVGSLIPHFKKTDFDKLELPVFTDIYYQKLIGKIYFDICAKIENNLAINKTLEEKAILLYKHWFVDFAPFRNEEFIESEIGLIPKGWEPKSVHLIAEFINGASFKSNDFVEDKTIGLPVIKIAEIKQGITSQTMYSNKILDSKYILNDNDILFPWSGNPHTSLGIHLWDKGKAFLNQHIFLVKVEKPMHRSFVFNTLKNLMPTFIKLATHKQTTGLGHITVKNLKELIIPFPNEKTINEYNLIATPTLELIYYNQMENQNLAQIRDTLLPKLISGEIRLKEFGKEVSKIL